VDATFDGPGLIIQLPSIGSFDIGRDLYSAWKRWAVQTDNAKFPAAFDITGGDDIGGGQQVAPYFFLRNDAGWRIRAPMANGEVALEGNLFPRDSGAATFAPAAGFDAFIRLQVSSRAVTVAGSGSVDQQGVRDALTAQGYTSPRAEALDRLDAAVTSRQPVGEADANIVRINGLAVTGSGTAGDPWGPA